MNPAGTFIQIIILIVAIVIGFTYLQPTFLDIQSIQDDIDVYGTERENVGEVNQLLQSLVEQVQNVDPDDQRALLTYIPDEVDALEKMSTLVAIGDESDFVVDSIRVGDGNSAYLADQENQILAEQTFSVGLSGEYSNVQPFLRLMEQNESPFYVTSMNITPESENDTKVRVSLELVTFSLRAPQELTN